MKNVIKKSPQYIVLFSFLFLSIILSCDNEDDSIKNARPLTISKVVPQTGFAGQNVTIYGTNFSSNPSDNILSFNGVNATILSANNNTITTSVPEGAITGNITVTTRNEEAPGPIFTVTLPPPTVSSINPTSGGPGTVVVFTGTNFSPLLSDNIVLIGGIEATIVSVTSTTLTVEVPLGIALGSNSTSISIQNVQIDGSDFIVLPFVELFVSINASGDDVEEAANGEMGLTSSDLEFGEFDTFNTPSGVDFGLQKIGLRFNNVQIPQGSTVTYVAIQFTADNIGSNPVQLTVYGEDIGNAPMYTTTDNDLSNRIKTTASVVWNIPEWFTIGDRLEEQKTINLTGIVQEIVNRPDWVSGNSINFIFEHSGPSIGVTSSSGGREAETYPSDEAELSIIHL